MLCRIKRKRFKFMFTSISGDRFLVKGPITTLNFPLPPNSVCIPHIVGSYKYLKSLYNVISDSFRGLVWLFR